VKKMIYGAIALILLFVLVLNSSILANQVVAWADANPKDPDAPLMLYRAGRYCNVMGDDNRALEIYEHLYQEYPERAELCAPAMYYSGEIKANGSNNILAYKKQALPFLDIVVNQYSSQEEWRTKAKKLYDEVNFAH
jgi:hypothetical protein